MSFFYPAESSNWIKRRRFSKSRIGTRKVFVKHENSKPPSKQVLSLENRGSGPASDVSNVHRGTSSFCEQPISDEEVKGELLHGDMSYFF